MKKAILAALFTVGLTGTAVASQCPGLMQQIDAELAKGPQLSAAKMAKVMELRAEGEEDHSGGKHDEAVNDLSKALKILQM